MPSRSYDVAIATSTYFSKYGNVPDDSYRRDLFLQLTNSLMRLDTMGAKICWLIGDDASPSFPVIETPLPFDVHLHRNETNLGQPVNYKATVEKARRVADWILVVDDDGLVSRSAIWKMFTLMRKYPTYNCYGAFNSPYHPVTQDLGDHVLKPSTCEHGRFFPRRFDGFGTVNHPIPVTKPSVVQHCGIYGLNGTKNDRDDGFTP